MFANVRGLCVRAELETQKLNMETQFNNSTNVEDSTSARLTQNPCYVQPFSEVYNEDCMQVMKRYPDKYFDLAVVDPPYGLGSKLAHAGNGKNAQSKFTDDFKLKNWDNQIPPYEYFIELFRVSKNQIIWGGNYFLQYLGASRGFITWDKMVFIPTMSRIEFAWDIVTGKQIGRAHV